MKIIQRSCINKTMKNINTNQYWAINFEAHDLGANSFTHKEDRRPIHEEDWGF